MNNGWVKLHRKMLDNENLKRDANCRNLLMHLLMLVDRDSGSYSCGRKQLAKLMQVHESNIYRTLRKLQKWGIVNIKSNSQFSTYTIVNWHAYQGEVNSQSNNNRTTGRTAIEHSYKNKEYNTENKEKDDYSWKIKPPDREVIDQPSPLADQVRKDLRDKRVL